jgi:hypothetical protein
MQWSLQSCQLTLIRGDMLAALTDRIGAATKRYSCIHQSDQRRIHYRIAQRLPAAAFGRKEVVRLGSRKQK